MRTIFIGLLILSAVNLSAQMTLPGGVGSTVIVPTLHRGDSLPAKKWFMSSYGGISTGYTFFRGGSAWIFATPLTLQLNRRLSNNWYAFAGITAAPSYLNFNSSFLSADPAKTNSNSIIYRPGTLSVYSAATMGLMYINDARTFSVSGSISIERSSYPSLYPSQYNSAKPSNRVLFSR